MQGPKHVVITAVSFNVHISAPLNSQSSSSSAITQKVMSGHKKKDTGPAQQSRIDAHTHNSQQHAQAAAVWRSQGGDGGFLMTLYL